MLQSSDFSIVVQGPIHSSPEHKGDRAVTIRCLASIRQFLPGAEIVLSTWNGAETDGLDYDILVKSEDPGAVPFNDFGVPPLSNNVNRQIVSTRAGFAAATRPFGIKFRGDLLWESDGFLHYSEDLEKPLDGRVFRSRVLITPRYTKNPRRSLFVFHFSDILQIGRMEDLRKIWSVPLAPEPETTRWLEGRTSALFMPLSGYFMRTMPEQYLMVGLLNGCGYRVALDHPKDVSPARVLLSERVLIDYFRVLEPAQLGVRFAARLNVDPQHYVYSAADWDRLARAYASWPRCWIVQGGLLAQTAWTVFDFFLKSLFGKSPLQNVAAYRWLRDLYRRIFPLP